MLSDVGALPGGFENELRDYVRGGGSALIALGHNSMAKMKVPVSDGRISESRYSGREGERFQTAAWLDPSYPSIQKDNDWAGVKFYRAIKIDPGKARVAARLSDETPLLIDQQLGEGHVEVFASTFDNIDNDFPLHKARSCRSSSRPRATWAAWIPVRRPCRWALSKNCAMRKEKGAAVDVVDPKGARVFDLREATTAQNVQFTMAGFYDIRRPNGRNELVAVNSDRRESDLTPAPPDTLKLWQNTASGDCERRNGADERAAEAGFALVVCNAGRVGPGGCRVAFGKQTSFGGQRGRMKPFDRLSEYLSALERRMRWLALTRGAAASAAAALALTVLAVLVANQFAFSHRSVVGARVFLFLGLAFAIAAALIVPVIRLNRRRAARAAESNTSAVPGAPAHIHRTLGDTTPAIRSCICWRPTRCTWRRTRSRSRVAKTTQIFSFSSAAVVSTLVLLWLATSGPGFLGYGTGLLWGSVPKGVTKPYLRHLRHARQQDRPQAFRPGDWRAASRLHVAQGAVLRQVRQRFAVGRRGYARGTGRLAPINSSSPACPRVLEYYVEAGGVRSQTFKLNVVDLPGVKKVAVTFHYPAYLGLKDRHRRSGRRPARGAGNRRRSCGDVR